MSQVIGIILIIVAIGLLADKLMFSPWERFMRLRWGTHGEGLRLGMEGQAGG